MNITVKPNINKPSTYSKQCTRTQEKHAGHLGQRESKKGWKWEERQLFQRHIAWVLAEGFSGRARSDGAGMSRQDSHFAVYYHLLGPGTKVSRNLCRGLRLFPSMSWEQGQVSHHCLLLRNQGIIMQQWFENYQPTVPNIKVLNN